MAIEDEYKGFTASNEAITAATNIEAEKDAQKQDKEKK